MKRICEICKNLIGIKNPSFIDISKIKKGMKLKKWFETTYQPKVGKYSPCDGYSIIRKVDGDLIFYSFNESTEVHISTRNNFTTSTLIVLQDNK